MYGSRSHINNNKQKFGNILYPTYFIHRMFVVVIYFPLINQNGNVLIKTKSPKLIRQKIC